MFSVMLVDDSKLTRCFLRDQLANSNYHVIAEAADGLEAIELFRLHKPDITILDIIIPYYCGMSCLRKMIEINSDSKIVMCSSIGQHFHIQEALHIGAIDYIIKPHFNELKKVLDKAIASFV
ncbi:MULTISPECIES: response regulator [Pontibacillus]|uniref:Response regulator n=1 Tax=Pontibacillus chungwhensis TaxID=265426 RepID=A0ABY8V145_9BACI|nr:MULTISPECIES: response regulator [Pontibacillus]MCD5322373.1 response regulator [Pontibacillus sp. HN14]WIF99660.1 response regulator [Pontibacillus chungwhensis]